VVNIIHKLHREALWLLPSLNPSAATMAEGGEAPKRGAKRQASEANIIHKLRSEAFWLLPID
jgi:hypothetical protein